jgi:hypothetical protein
MTAGIASPEKDGQFAPEKNENFKLLIGNLVNENMGIKKTHSN